MNKNRALTVEEVAGELQIAKNTVYELIKRGELRSYKVGRKVRIDSIDLEQYINRSKEAAHMGSDHHYNGQQSSTAGTHRPNSGFASDEIPVAGGFVISGQDSMLDIIANMLQNHPEGTATLRSYVGSYKGLIGLYQDQCQVTAIHMWDSDSDTYNVPYVRRLVPGVPCVVIRLAKREQGFYVAKGNPKNIKSWVDLTRDDVTMVNREKGSGTRILLDEKFRMLSIKPNSINGYYNEKTSHIAIANAVAKGTVDVGIGCGAAALRVGGIDFIPIQSECYDLVIKTENLNDPTYKLLYDIVCSDAFRENVESLTGYDFESLGQIVAEL